MTHLLDLATRKFWRGVGRRVDLRGEHRWLRAPTSHGPTVADSWLAEEAALHGGHIEDDLPEAGLLPDMSALDGPEFGAAELDPRVRDFYEHTAAWRMEVWTSWAPLFWVPGELVARLFGRRVEQLALPMRPLEVAHGMDSRVTVIRDGSGRQVAAAWLRTLRRTGRYVYSGAYSTRLLPGADQPSIHVAFPLESGNVQVFLRPSVAPDGALALTSPAGPFGRDGAYVVVEDGGRTYAARVPIHESFRVYVDPSGVLRTDHELRLGPAVALRLHYRLDRSTAS